jgi:nucleotide sugar dehydrogenase
MKENGQCDTSIVEESVAWLTEQNPDSLILIKSTVEPGTTDRLKETYGGRIVFSPEYVGEGKYFTPAWKYPDPVHTESHGFMVMGGAQEDMEEIAQIFVRKMGPHTRFTFLEAKEAEFVKYWENIWGATKVIFANQMYDAAQAMGVNFYRAREGWIADPRVEPMHTAVFEKARGFSGKCFPKDLSAFIYACEQHGFDPTLLKEVWNINADYRPEEFSKKK